MLYGEMIAVCSEIHTKHIHVLLAEHRISECLSRGYMKVALGFESLNKNYVVLSIFKRISPAHLPF
jgi:hypothetical protein